MSGRFPVGTETKIYLPWEYEENTLQKLMEEAQRKWFGVDFKDVVISCKNIQTSGCSCHPDSGDYTNYITLELKPEAKRG